MLNIGLQFSPTRRAAAPRRTAATLTPSALAPSALTVKFVLAGNILVRQRGTHIHPGVNVGIGSDDTLYAKESGVLRFERLGKDRKQASVYPAE